MTQKCCYIEFPLSYSAQKLSKTTEEHGKAKRSKSSIKRPAQRRSTSQLNKEREKPARERRMVFFKDG